MTRVPALTCPQAHAETDSDVNAWFELGLEVELAPKLELELAQHLRLADNASRVSAVMPAVGLDLEVLRVLSLGVGYRLEYKRDDGELDAGHRVHGDVDLSLDLWLFRASNRVRLQDTIREADNDELRLRDRVQLEWRRRGWDPGVSAEVFVEPDSGGGTWKKTRFTAGVEFEAWDQDVGTFYRVDVPRDYSEPLAHIVGLELETKL
jgi:hypothetical protein